MLGQLASLSAIAVETAESLPEVPDLALGELPGEGTSAAAPEPADDPTPDAEGSEAPEGSEASEDDGQNNRSSTLSIPRSTS